MREGLIHGLVLDLLADLQLGLQPTMDAIQFLKQEHEKAKAAFGKVLKAAPDTRGELKRASRTR